MKILILSLDNSEKIVVGGKHIHQILFKEGLEALGHEVSWIFPKRTWLYLLKRLFLKTCQMMGVGGRASIFRLILHSYCESLASQARIFSADFVIAQDPVSACAAHRAGIVKPIFMTLHGIEQIF